MRLLPLPHVPPIDKLPPGWSPPAARPKPAPIVFDQARLDRLLEAELQMLQTLAELAPAHACDPRWLRAAARKECCMARLLREVRKCKGEDGDKGDGDGQPEFSGAGLQPFLELLEQHNAKKEMLQQWRRDFQRIAGDLAEFVKERLSQGYADTVYPHVRPEGTDVAGLPHACLFDIDHLTRVFSHPRGGEGAGPTVFNPWTGRWHGKWTSGEEEERNFEPYHVWDRTRQVEDDDDGEEQHVQPVTQSTRRYIGREEIDSDPDREGVQPPPDADLAINVYGSECGITGWVVKPDRNASDDRDDTQVLPHVGYRVAPGVIIWITQIHHPNCEPWGEDEPFIIFFEWVDENGLYGILGKRFRLRRDAGGEIDADEPIDGVQPTGPDVHGYPNERHGGVYRKE